MRVRHMYTILSRHEHKQLFNDPCEIFSCSFDSQTYILEHVILRLGFSTA